MLLFSIYVEDGRKQVQSCGVILQVFLPLKSEILSLGHILFGAHDVAASLSYEGLLGSEREQLRI